MILVLILGVLAIFLLYNVWRGAPYVPSRDNAVQAMIALAAIRPGEQACDLGSGDGRIVIALAMAGAIAHGYETNPILVWLSRRKIKKQNLQGRAFIHWNSLWSSNLRDFQIVTIFGITHIMSELGEKITREMEPGSRVLSNIFKFENLALADKRGTVGLYK